MKNYKENKDYILAVRFKRTGKLNYFNPLKYDFKIGDNIIAETDRGREIGRVVKLVDKESIGKDIKVANIIKPASWKDIETQKENEQKAKEDLKRIKELVKEQNLNMKVLSAEYIFDMSKLIIYFVSEERVDFRELVKELALEFKVRIELRQIGPRDEVKEFPTLGMCGKEVCCRTFLQDFEPVTIKLAKDQGLQINMSKLSGSCGKLMCCLKYEDEAYKENLEKLPKVGAKVTVKKEKITGVVTNVDIIGLKVKVKFVDNKEDEYYETYDVKDIKWDKK